MSSSSCSIVGILLAAGASQRFGTNKLVQPLSDGEWVAVRACRNLLSGTGSVLAVVRPNSEILVDRLQAVGARVMVCKDAELGVGESLAFGVRACPEAAGWMVALADMPWIMPATIGKVADGLRSGAMISAPAWRGRRGHPVGFSSALRAELTELSGDIGAKSLIQAHREQMVLIDCDDPAIVRDIDEPADLENME